MVRNCQLPTLFTFRQRKVFLVEESLTLDTPSSSLWKSLTLDTPTGSCMYELFSIDLMLIKSIY